MSFSGLVGRIRDFSLQGAGFSRSKGPGKQGPVRLLLASLMAFGFASAAGAVDVTTFHNDPQRTGLNNNETVLNVTNVASSNFGLLNSITLPGDESVTAQPLVVSAATFAANGVSQFTHDVVYVATSLNNVYAIDSVTGSILVQANLGPAVAMANLPGGCTGNYNTVGITSTPVIDTAAGVMYVVAYTWENNTPVYRVHELNLVTLGDAIPSVVVSATQTLSDGSSVSFQAGSQRQRPALLKANGNIYAAFGSFCDWNTNITRGWLLGWKAGTLTPLPAAQLTNKETTAQAGSGMNSGWGGPQVYFLSAIWMSGYGPAADSSGNIYFLTGNSSGNIANNLEESAVEVSPDLSTVVSYFTPNNYITLDQTDNDLGSGGIIVVPSQGGPQFAVGGGKDGRMFLFNQNNLGGYASVGNDVPTHVYVGACWCGPTYFVGSDGKPRIVSSGGVQAQTWLLPSTAGGNFTYEAAAPPMPAGQDPSFVTSASSNGVSANTAIIWATSRDVNGYIALVAYNATAAQGALTQLATFPQAGLWASPNTNANAVPTVANGKVYVASYKTLNIFGLQGNTTISSSPNPATAGQAVTLTATITPSGQNSPTGTVTFYDSATTLGNVTVSNANAAYTTSSLTVGNHTITASYSGDANTPAGTSRPLTQTITAAPTQPPVITSALTASGTVGAPFSYQTVATNSPISFAATGLPAGLSINPATGLISGAPTAVGTSSVTLTASNSIGNGTATLALSVSNYYSLFSTSMTPAIVTVSDANPVELGVVFSPGSNGYINGLRFYKGPQNTGTHTGHLWDSSGALLASATFTNETASGWQTVTFSSPVAVTANAEYVASYHSNGYYSANNNFFTGNYVNGPLSAPASAANTGNNVGGNGVYAYGSATSYPTYTYYATNYWVDVLFSLTGTGGAPVITSATNATGTVGQAFSYQITASNSPTSFGATGLPAGLSINTTTGLISGTPTTGGTYGVTISAANGAGQGTATLALTIGSAAPSITSALSASGTAGQAFSYQITATNSPTSFGATGLPAGLTINTTTGLISGTPTTAGSSSVTLSAKNAAGTGTATLNLTINAPVPVITSATSATGMVGQAFSYQITASNSPTSFGATGLPAGLSINTTTGLISGTPTTAGSSSVTLSAKNAAGTGTATLSLTINASVPVITSATSATGTVGQAFNYQITASNSPTSFGASGLPAGVTVNTTTGLISGTPTTAGSYAVTLSAKNGGGTGTATLNLTINASAPVITSATSATGTVGQAFSYQITASNSPTSFGASGLPAGLTVNTTTGLISGTPTTAGSYAATVSAANGGGTGTASLTLTINGSSALLLGSAAVQPTVDSNDLGNAEAFQTTAAASGTLHTLTVYLDPSSTVKTLVVGLYSDASGQPGSLITQGSSSTLTAGAWNSVSVTPGSVTAGAKYWIAVLGMTQGALVFRDGSGCTSVNSLQNNLTSLPATWSSGQSWPSCPLSAYGN